ncbi:MAG TPA: hypothetical protein VNJ04_17830 [Gemmatimonadaceae bacterium]|nr:hypothetical protein [Gemmatimonadaceae bacterium]
MARGDRAIRDHEADRKRLHLLNRRTVGTSGTSVRPRTPDTTTKSLRIEREP